MSVTKSRAAAGLCWLAGVVALAVGAWVVCDIPPCGATPLDAAMMNWFAQRRSVSGDLLFRTITWLGSIAILVPLVVASMLILKFDRRIREAYFLGTALVGTVVIMHLSKLLIARPRPADAAALIDVPWDQSFPSAHSAQIVSILFGGVIVLGRSNRALSKWLLLLALPLALLVGVSRIYLQVHYPTDVLVGMIMGLSWVTGLALWMFPPAKIRSDDHA